jgi:general secretion pathway protein D
MKTMNHNLIAGAFALTLAASLVAQESAPSAAPAPATPAADSATPTAADARREARRAERQKERRATKKSSVVTAPAAPSAASAVKVVTPAAPAKPAPEEERKLRLNFRGVPLDMVLNYLSEAAGYIIMLETPVKGSVDVWSNEPLSKREAIDLLNTVLNKNGYAAVQNGRMLTIVAKDEAKKRNLPVVKGSEPESIPKNDEMVTQILPVKYIAASQLVRDLQPLMPTSAVITANDGGNALVITDTQSNIRRVAEIVAALDTAQAGTSGIRVFPLKYADAKALATTIRDLFQDVGRNSGSSSSSRTSRSTSGGPGGPPGGGDPRAMFAQMIASRTGGGGSSSGGPAASTRVTAVADEHSNSLIVSAAEDMMPTIEAVIASVDTDVQDLTELRVFTLKNADPTEMAQLLTDLFATQTDSSRGGGLRFGSGGFPGSPFGGGFPGSPFGGGFPGGGRTTRTGSGDSESDRKKKQGQVTAVADPRTSSVVVTAAKDLMPQIAEMVLQLDSNPARKQKVFVYSLENANVQEVETVLRSLFETQNTRGTSGQQQIDALQNRANQASQQQGLNIGGGFGGGGGLGGGGFR